MPKNIGKKFEQDIQDSCNYPILLKRLNDSAQSYNQNGGMRFTLKNPFDFYLHINRHYPFMCLELKSVQGKSISFERTKNDKGVIHYHQIQGLLEVSKYDDVLAGFIINFRENEETYFIEINEFYKMIGNLDKKSFNINDLREYNCVLISSLKKRTRYKYDMVSFIENFRFKE